jgi:hypothetical protein
MLRRILLVIIPVILVTSCNEEDKKCTDEFSTAYERMGDSFEAVYAPRTGSFELNNLAESIDLFLSSHEGTTCKYNGQKINPTAEAKAMRDLLPEMTATLAKEGRIIPKVIYGPDNRVQVADATSEQKQWASATLAQISPREWDANFNFTSKTYGDAFTLCPGERFFDELSVANCSGFLVAPDVVVTAGHCMQSQNDCDNFKWVLDYKDGATKTSADKIFSCERVISQKLEADTQNDYAVIKLDRPVEGRKFFRIRTSGKVATNTDLVLIGHPSGLSTKVAAGAVVRESSSDIFFSTNTDSFGGNSGSAVINASTGVVEGILVRGDQDYDVIDGPDGNRCRVERECPNNGCAGEDVTRMTAVEGIPLIADVAQVRKGFFQEQDFPTSREGLPLEFHTYSFSGSSLGGLKFLDRCGIHFFEDNNPEAWEKFYAGKCSDRGIDQVIDTFANLFYL